jgi:hypothetical protein
MHVVSALASRCVLAAMLLVVALAPSVADDAVPADCSAAPPPAEAAHGDVLGKPVDAIGFVITTLGPVTLAGQGFTQYQLEFASDNEGTPDVEFRLAFILKPGEALDRRILRRLAGPAAAEQPGPVKGAAEIQSWSIDDHPERVKLDSDKDAAAIRVELGARRDNAIQGRLWICVPARQTAVGGSFEAQIGN